MYIMQSTFQMARLNSVKEEKNYTHIIYKGMEGNHFYPFPKGVQRELGKHAP